jgi:hypothetical protein
MAPVKKYHSELLRFNFRHLCRIQNRGREKKVIQGTRSYIFYWSTTNFRNLRKIVKIGYLFSHVCLLIRPSVLFVPLSVRFPYGTTRFQQERFSRNFILEDFMKIYRENLSLFEIWQEQMVLYMTTNVHLWLCLAQFFLESGIFHTNFVEKIKIHISSSIQFCRKSCSLSDNMEKCGSVKQATVDNIMRRRKDVICMSDN